MQMLKEGLGTAAPTRATPVNLPSGDFPQADSAWQVRNQLTMHSLRSALILVPDPLTPPTPAHLTLTLESPLSFRPIQA